MNRFFLAVATALSLTCPVQAESAKAIVAGGCFWCVESDFEQVPGVTDVVSGYSGGTLKNPTYENHDGHYEVVEITYDPVKLSYADLLAKFLRSVDVTDPGGQFCDRGNAYRTAIFVSDDLEKATAEAAIAEAESVLGQKVVTPVKFASTFWIAESYHQDYYKGDNFVLTRAGPKRQSNAYKFYRKSCGRDQRVKALWGSQALDH